MTVTTVKLTLVKMTVTTVQLTLVTIQVAAMQLSLARTPDQTTRATICRTTRAHQDSTTASSKQTWVHWTRLMGTVS
jgi:hypothetical protein